MPYAYTCERILATVDWAHAELREHKKASGYAMDAMLKTPQQGTSRAGKFARYLRGENTPNEDLLRQMPPNYGSEAIERWYHPLYDVLQRGPAGLVDNPEPQWLFDIERRLDVRLTRHWSAMVIESVPITPARAQTLAAYANSYALAALLTWALSGQFFDQTEAPGSDACLRIGQRAFQCLILSMASGEFPQTGPVLTARIRQRVLDQLQWKGYRLDTASVDVPAAVIVGRRWLAQTREHATPGKQRSALRALLKDGNAEDLATITPRIVPAAQAEAAHRQHRVRLAFGQIPSSKANLVSGYGARASRQLRIALNDYLQA